MSVLSGCPYKAGSVKVRVTCITDKRTKADIFTATKCLNFTLALKRLNYGNLLVVYHTLEEIYQAIKRKF